MYFKLSIEYLPEERKR